MSVEELRKNFWKAGSSSKNTPEAQAAGVVGTFGIGAMANFGIASSLTVETESMVTRERTACFAEKAKLSVTEECIDFRSLEPTGQFGTTIRASIAKGSEVEVHGATEYIREFVKYLRFPVRVNGAVVSLNDLGGAVPRFAQAWKASGTQVSFGAGVSGDYELEVAGTGEVRIEISNVSLDAVPVFRRSHTWFPARPDREPRRFSRPSSAIGRSQPDTTNMQGKPPGRIHAAVRLAVVWS